MVFSQPKITCGGLTFPGNPMRLGRVKVSLIAAGVLLLAGSCAWAQVQRADNASRTAATVQRVDAATTTAGDGISFDAPSEVDTDLGEQLPVSMVRGGLGAYVVADTGLFYTSNPTLANGGGRGDMYFLARGGAGIHPNLVDGLYLDAHVTQEVFQYAQFSSLNFTRFNAGGGLDYVFQDLGQLTVSVRYEYDRYLDGNNLDEFYVNNAVNVLVTKQFLISDTQAIQVGWQGSWSVYAQPTSATRNSYDFWVGWRWRIIEPLELQTYYVITLFHYPDDDNRVDLTQNVGGSVNYYFTKWAKISASANFGGNASTESFYNYTVVNLGGTLGLDFRF